MCSADEEGRSFSQRQEGTQSHPSRAGQDLFWDLKSVQHGSMQDWRVLEEEAEERDGLDCVIQRFWILCQYAGEPQKTFEQARSIQICELELFGNCGNGKKMVSTLFMKCVAFPMAAICFSYCFPPFQDFFFWTERLHYSTPVALVSFGQNFRGIQVRCVTCSCSFVLINSGNKSGPELLSAA